MSDVAIQYVGRKATEQDWKVAGTGLTWRGFGDVQMVPADAAAKLLKHRDVWSVAYDEPTQSLVEPSPVIESMDRAALIAYAESARITIDKRRNADGLREQIRAALKA